MKRKDPILSSPAIRDNIRYLREYYDETLDALAEAIGEEQPKHISEYATDSRPIPQAKLREIAKHYNVTEDMLINGDLSFLKNMEYFPINDEKVDRITLNTIWPVVSSGSAIKNEKFKKAYELHLFLRDCVILKNNFNENQIALCMDLYKQAAEEHILEARANLLSLILWYGMCYRFTSIRLIRELERLDRKQISGKDLAKYTLYTKINDCDDEEKQLQQDKIDFAKENITDTLVHIALLKKSIKYAELGDYYFALTYTYTWGLISSNNISEATRLYTGTELMQILSTIGNPFAEKYISYLNKRDGIEPKIGE